ncbi:hypothetical protein HMPREF9952_1174 [Haemophilus pittmaniae HK 85]|uniref:Uncharacterized protein n=1 Tax=Haemophilus pittmaniae HK 85 TaxID=1035188 RepID=F9Q5P2_9PAST|nr:hypothetical protein HMPREF9952_1174 [Haemophilus pittmaniae HK 85]
MTAWIDNGRLQSLPDIYNYDSQANFNGINWSVVSKYL